MVRSALDSGVPIDITNQPALWGGKMRGTSATLIATGTTDYENANDEAHACDLVQAHLIETLSAIGRETIDIYYFRVKRMAEEFQLSGALQALELAKQEGHIGHIGIRCDGPSFATLGAWQFHDAFETLMVPRNHADSESYDTLAPLAKERRVGIVTDQPFDWGGGDVWFGSNLKWTGPNGGQIGSSEAVSQAILANLAADHPVLVGVSSPKEVELAISSPASSPLADFSALLPEWVNSFQSDCIRRSQRKAESF